MRGKNKCIWEYLGDWKDATVTDIDYLVQAGADVNREWSEYSAIPLDYRYGSHRCAMHTPLECAVRAENFPVVKYLLEHGANPNVIITNERHYDGGLSRGGGYDYEEIPVFSFALGTGKHAIIDLFFKHGADPYAFYNHLEYFSSKDPRCFPSDHPRSLKARDDFVNRSPVMVAIRMNDVDALKKMLSSPYKVPKRYMEIMSEKISESGCLTPGELYWDAFIDQMTRAERKKLREELATATKQNNRKQADTIIEKLVGKKIGRGGRAEDPLRKRQASEYKSLRRKYSSDTAREAHRTLQERRSRVLGK